MGIIISHDSTSDCNLRWSRCYGKYTKNGEERLIHIHAVREVRGQEVLIRGSLYVPEHGMWETRPDWRVQDNELNMEHICTGNVDVGNASYFVSKCLGGSYRLGVSTTRYSILSPHSTALQAVGYRSVPTLGTVVPKMYNPKYRPVERSVKMILDKQIISAGVTPYLSIGLNRNLHFLGMHRGSKLLGEYNYTENVVNLPYKHRYFVEELQEQGFDINLLKVQKNDT